MLADDVDVDVTVIANIRPDHEFLELCNLVFGPWSHLEHNQRNVVEFRTFVDDDMAPEVRAAHAFPCSRGRGDHAGVDMMIDLEDSVFFQAREIL